MIDIIYFFLLFNHLVIYWFPPLMIDWFLFLRRAVWGSQATEAVVCHKAQYLLLLWISQGEKATWRFLLEWLLCGGCSRCSWQKGLGATRAQLPTRLSSKTNIPGTLDVDRGTTHRWVILFISVHVNNFESKLSSNYFKDKWIKYQFKDQFLFMTTLFKSYKW